MINELENQILVSGNEYVYNQEIPFLPIRGYLDYLENGNRLRFEDAYFLRRRQLSVLALSYYLKKDENTLNLLEQIIWEICNEYTWALPAHLPIEKRNFKMESKTWIDLFAAETGQALSEIMELLSSDFSELTKERVHLEINNRIFKPFEEKEWDWEYKKNNWASVIGGSIGMAALSLLPLKSIRQKKIISRLSISMNSYLEGYGDDGVCEEGVSYWGYGFGYYIYYAEKLASKLGDNSLLEKDKVKKIAEFPFHMLINDKQYIPFSDYSVIEMPTGLLSFCKEYFQVEVPNYKHANTLDFDTCYRFAQLFRNIVWTKKTNKIERDEIENYYFPNKQWWIHRNNLNELYFAAKGGGNNESHNHTDVGHFIFGTVEEILLTDLGAGEYTKDYFNDEKRYGIFPNSAESHSIPIINGSYQENGNLTAEAFYSDDQVLKLNLTTFYNDAGITAVQREFKIDNERLTIQDDIDFIEEQNIVVENFLTKYRPTIKENVVFIDGDKNSCFLVFETSKIKIKEKKYRNHEGREENAFLIQAEYTANKRVKIKTKICFK